VSLLRECPSCTSQRIWTASNTVQLHKEGTVTRCKCAAIQGKACYFDDQWFVPRLLL